MLVQILLEKEAVVNERDDYGDTALHTAVWHGRISIVQTLLENGADINLQNQDGTTALIIASWTRPSIYDSTWQISQTLLENGADVNFRVSDDHGTALQAASERGCEHKVWMLLEKGADVNAGGGVCGKPLFAASVTGHTRVAQILLENGADIDAIVNKIYGTALQAALGRHGVKHSTVKLLLKSGASIDVRDGDLGRLGWALQSRRRCSHADYASTVQLLLTRSVGVNIRSSGGDGAFMDAVLEGRDRVVRFLLESGV